MTVFIRSALFASVLATFAVGARESPLALPNHDVNTAAAKGAGLPASSANRDAIGRETFAWIQPGELAKAAHAEPEHAAREQLAALLRRAKRSVGGVETLTDVRVDRMMGGAALVRMQPRLDGVPIFHEEVALVMDAERRLVAMRGPLPREQPDAAKSLSPFELDAVDAIAAALAPHGFAIETAERAKRVAVHGEYSHYRVDEPAAMSGVVADGEQRAKRVYFRTMAGLQPAWYVETAVSDGHGHAMHAHVVSAVDGTLLFRTALTAHAPAAFSYRVYAEPDALGLPYPNPFGRALTPDPDGLPTADVAPFAPMQLLTRASGAFSRAATDPWLPENATVTSGNNANAYADLAAPNGLGAGDLQPSVTAPRTFDYPFEPTLAPLANANQSHAATVNAFYIVNWLHDWFYDHGFAEVDGNGQLDNFGRGGLGNDAIRVEAQDAAAATANMATPADGGAPRMQLGYSIGPPGHTRAMAGVTIAHEWGHYLSNRLIGDGSGLFTEHAGGQGEGWSDFVALLMQVKEEDRLKPANASFSGAYGRAYTSANSYYGAWRYPYSTDLAKNPFSLRHIVDGTPMPAIPPPAYGADGADNTQVHAQGSVWATALWDCYASLLNDTQRLTFAEAQRRMKSYLVASLKLTPVAPTMVESRDAMLAAVLATGEQRDYELFVAAFAKRGLGAGAYIPDRYSRTMAGVVESHATGGAISATAADLGVPVGCDADPTLDAGDTANVAVTLTNTGFATLDSTSVTLAASDPALTFPSGATVNAGSIPRRGQRTVYVPVRLGAGVASDQALTVTATPSAGGQSVAGPPATVATTVNIDQVPRSSTVENFGGTYVDWRLAREPAGFGPGTWSLRRDGAARMFHGDDTHANSVSWAQTPTMSVGGGPLVVTLLHRYLFEAGDRLYDGGLIQASTDGGATWADLDPAAAGFDVPLSDCCGNPAAGRRAYTDSSLNYPNFVERVIDLGTRYANQPNFRLRFGVATDASAHRGGWDIASLSVSGLTDTPFSSVRPQPAACATAANKKLDSALAGTYYAASRSGEGVIVDIGRIGSTPVVFFSWYTYELGRQQWLVGSSAFGANDTAVALDLVQTKGARFGSGFRPEDVVRSAWGSVSLTFPTCDTMELTYRKLGGEIGTQTLTRGFERAAPAECPAQGGRGGTYYSEARNGEGVLVDFGRLGGASFEFFAWYTYDGGTQQWLVGSQPYTAGAASTVLDLFRTEGARFGNGFDTRDVVTTPWGRVTQRFIDCDTLELAYEKTGGESGTMLLKRGFRPIGDGQCR